MRRPADALRGAFCFLALAAITGVVQAADPAPPSVQMWDCTYVAQPEPAIRCEPAKGSALTATSAPLWDPEAATRESAIEIPLFTAPREIRADRMMGLAHSAVCAGKPDCYVTWHAPAAR